MKPHIANHVLCVAAVKYASKEDITSIIQEGTTTLGWSTLQQLQKLHELLPKDQSLHHHFIGHLQGNKVNQLLSSDIELIHSIDSVELFDRINRAAIARKKHQPILLQVKTDPTKEYGLTREEADGILASYMKQERSVAGAIITGLMTIPPLVKNPEENRHIYKEMRELQTSLEKRYAIALPNLSMGMSDDYPIAIEEGATMVRLGRILFEKEEEV